MSLDQYFNLDVDTSKFKKLRQVRFGSSADFDIKIHDKNGLDYLHIDSDRSFEYLKTHTDLKLKKIKNLTLSGRDINEKYEYFMGQIEDKRLESLSIEISSVDKHILRFEKLYPDLEIDTLILSPRYIPEEGVLIGIERVYKYTVYIDKDLYKNIKHHREIDIIKV